MTRTPHGFFIDYGDAPFTVAVATPGGARSEVFVY
jgi:hypothetical protein